LRKTWKGIILDGSNENKSINLYKEFITANNIPNLILLYKIPKNLGIFVIDIDYNDAYVAFKTLTQLSPSIVIAEYNMLLGMEDKTVIHDPNYYWDRSVYWGCSALCIQKIYKNYEIVYANKVNLFLIRRDILETLNIKPKRLSTILKPIIYKKPPARFKKDYFNRTWVTSAQVNNAYITLTTRISKIVESFIQKKKDSFLKKLILYRKIDYKKYEKEAELLFTDLLNSNKSLKKNYKELRTLFLNKISHLK
jgi:hypothetical protein